MVLIEEIGRESDYVLGKTPRKIGGKHCMIWDLQKSGGAIVGGPHNKADYSKLHSIIGSPALMGTSICWDAQGHPRFKV